LGYGNLQGVYLEGGFFVALADGSPGNHYITIITLSVDLNLAEAYKRRFHNLSSLSYQCNMGHSSALSLRHLGYTFPVDHRLLASRLPAPQIVGNWFWWLRRHHSDSGRAARHSWRGLMFQEQAHPQGCAGCGGMRHE
jgi:hypothetical protein